MKRVLGVLVLLLCLCLVGCNGGKDDSIKLGVVGPFTGDLSTYGNNVKRGVEIAVEEINANGGILGKDVELLVEDTQGDSEKVLNAYYRVSDDADFVVGEVTSGNSEILAKQAQADKMPTITASATAESVTKGRDYVFRSCFLDPDQGVAMANFAKDTLNANTAVVVYDQSDDYSKGVAEAFKAQAEAKNIEVVEYNGGLKAKEATYATLVELVVSKNADCVFAPVYYGDVAVFAKELRTAGYTKPLLGADGFDGVLGQLLAEDYGCVNNTYYSCHYDPNNEKVKAFVATYKEKYNEEPAAFALLAYDAVYLIKAAMEQAGSTDKVAVVEALKAIDYKGGLTGDFKFDANNNPVKTITVIEFVNGVATFKQTVTK